MLTKIYLDMHCFENKCRLIDDGYRFRKQYEFKILHNLEDKLYTLLLYYIYIHNINWYKKIYLYKINENKII